MIIENNLRDPFLGAPFDDAADTEPCMLERAGVRGGDPTLSPEARLMQLLVETDACEVEQAERERASARERRHQALNKQIDELHDAARDIMTGAFASMALSVAGGACQLNGVTQQVNGEAAFAKTSETWGRLLSDCADPMQALVGSAPAKHHEADATKAADDKDAAKTREDEASARKNRVLSHTDRVMEMIRELMAAEARSRDAILADG